MISRLILAIKPRIGIAAASLVLLLIGAVPLAAQVYFKAGPDGFRFGNSYLERVFERDGESFRTAWLVNKLSGHTWRVSSGEFRLRFTYERLGYSPGRENPLEIGAKDCFFRGYRIEESQAGERRLVLEYHWNPEGMEPSEVVEKWPPGIELEVTYSLTDSLPFMHKALSLSSKGDKYYFVEELAVEELSIPGEDFTHQGFGQPVYTGEMFFGLEYPAGNDRAADGRLSLFYYPGAALGPSALASYPAVWGVAPRGRTRASFLDYVARIRYAPARPFLLYNTWYDLRTAERFEDGKGDLLNLETSLFRVRSLKENLVDHGIILNSFVLDEGWDRYTPFWEINPKIFPGGFGRLSRALSEIGSGLGLWLGPTGGYGDGLRLRSEAARKAGLETSHKGYLDLAGPRYNAILKKRLSEFIRDYDVNYYKFDGVLYGYAGTDHGILPGVYSREAQTAALANLCDTLHAIKPDLFINVTTSQWLSPWWLLHADCVFLGGGDYGWLGSLPSPTKRDLAISYRDQVCYEQFHSQDYQFPMNSIMTVGVIKGDYQLLGELNETLDKWTDDVIMHFSRGLSMWELYISPRTLKAEEWESLRAGIKWATDNSPVLLANSTMVGGEPGGREPYGYFHCGPEKMILTLRNPYVEPKTFRLKLDYESGWLEPNEEAYLPLTVYPYQAVENDWMSYGETLETRLVGYETKVIVFIRRDKVDFPIFRRVGFEATPGGMTLYPESPLEKVTVANNSAGEFSVAGRQVPVGGWIELPLEAAGKAESLEMADKREEKWQAGGAGLSGTLALGLPPVTVSAEVAFLVELDRPVEGLAPALKENGASLPYHTQAGEDKKWYWFVASVKPGSTHEIEYDFACRAADGAGGSLSAWLVLRRRIEGVPVTVPDIGPSLSGKSRLPAETAVRRGVECLFRRDVRY